MRADKILESHKVEFDLWVGRSPKDYLAGTIKLDLDQLISSIHTFDKVKRGEDYKVSNSSHLVQSVRRMGPKVSVNDKWILDVDDEGRITVMTTDEELRFISATGEL